MSSLAASRADGFYYPPNYDPAKHGSLNQFNGQHPLRERANKLDQGILVIRFEMPFNVWCAGCNHLIGKGVRFNAEKKQIGTYYSTKIWSFTMNAPCCGQKIEVQTDPKNTEYNVVSGGRRKVETWTAENAETIELPEKEEEQFAPRVDDTFARLEKGEADKLRAKELNSRVSELYQDSNAKFKNDYELNKQLRRQNRGKRTLEKDLDKKRKSLGLSDDVTLLPETEDDRMMASCIHFGDPANFGRKWQQKRKAIRSQSIFAPSALTKLGQKWEETIGQRWDSLSNKARKDSSEEKAVRPIELQAYSQGSPVMDSEARSPQTMESEEMGKGEPQTESLQAMEIDCDSLASTQTDDEQIKPSDQIKAFEQIKPSEPANSALKRANESWPAEPVKCSKLDASPDLWVCSREASAGMAKFFKCPLNTISEDREMDCSQLARDRHGKGQSSSDGPKVMRKLDKSKCRAQLASCGSSSAKRASLAQCQQKLKKTSLSDKIAKALKRQ